MVNATLVNILEACGTIKNLNDRFDGFRGILKFSEKKEYNSLKEQVREKILDLRNEIWTTEYIRKMEETLFAYRSVLQEYFTTDDLYIVDYDLEDINISEFKTMYIKNNNDMISLDILLDDIIFEASNPMLGKSLSVVSSRQTNNDQKVFETLFKESIIAALLKYLDS